MSIAVRDAENLLNLLAEEEENNIPAQKLPDSIPPEHRKMFLDLQEKLYSCHTIIKTVKKRYQQQKSLIRKAQERIKFQIQEIQHVNEMRSEEKEEYQNEIVLLQKSMRENENVISEKEKIVLRLQVIYENVLRLQIIYAISELIFIVFIVWFLLF